MKKISFLLIILVAFAGCNGNAQKKKVKEEQFPIQKTDAEWKKELTSEQYYILRQAETEKPFSSELLTVKGAGTFVCAACNHPLYENKHKFKSGTGWPSFDQPIKGGVFYSIDNKLGYTRNEVLCANCGGHLGHVFDDGPKETTGKRYCMNGDAMKFILDEK